MEKIIWTVIAFSTLQLPVISLAAEKIETQQELSCAKSIIKQELSSGNFRDLQLDDLTSASTFFNLIGTNLVLFKAHDDMQNQFTGSVYFSVSQVETYEPRTGDRKPDVKCEMSVSCGIDFELKNSKNETIQSWDSRCLPRAPI